MPGRRSSEPDAEPARTLCRGAAARRRRRQGGGHRGAPPRRWSVAGDARAADRHDTHPGRPCGRPFPGNRPCRRGARMNVLMTAASRRVPLLRAFQATLRALGRGRVVVTDIDPSSPAVHLADRAFRVPISSDPGYVDALLEICVAEKIGLVVPTIDDELEILADARGRFDAAGAVLACSP